MTVDLSVLTDLIDEFKRDEETYRYKAEAASTVAMARAKAGVEHSSDAAAVREFRAWAEAIGGCRIRLVAALSKAAKP